MRNSYLHKLIKLIKYKHSLLFVVVAYITIKFFSLTYVNFLDNYPYFSSDSFSWISDGYYYLGYSTNSVVRAPFYPLLIALLEGIGILQLLPSIGYLTYILLLFYLYKLLKLIDFTEYISLVAVGLFSVSWLLDIYSTIILADIYALTFISISLYYYIYYLKYKRHLNLSFASLAISVMFQYAGFIILLIYSLVLIFKYKKSLFKQREFYIASIIFVALVAPWFVYRFFEYGNPLYTEVIQFELMRLHFDGLPFYLYSTISFLGIPAALITLIGIFVSLKGKISLVKVTLLGYFLAFLTFWVLFYDWLDIRFLIYFTPLILLSLGSGLNFIFLKLKNLKLKSYFMLGIIALSTFYIAYFNGSTTALTIFPSIYYQPEVKIDAQARLHLNLEGGSIGKRQLNIRDFKMVESIIVKKEKIEAGEANIYENLKDELRADKGVCLLRESTLDKYSYNNILSILSKSEVGLCLDGKKYNYMFTDISEEDSLCSFGYIRDNNYTCLK